MKKASPAQIAARKLFAERARAGTLKKRRKNPTVKTVKRVKKNPASSPVKKLAAKVKAAVKTQTNNRKRNPLRKMHSPKASKITDRPLQAWSVWYVHYPKDAYRKGVPYQHERDAISAAQQLADRDDKQRAVTKVSVTEVK